MLAVLLERYFHPCYAATKYSMWKWSWWYVQLDREHTTMNIKFNSANLCTPKNLAKQLIVESAKILNHQQRQALVDIFKTLDQAEKSVPQPILPQREADPSSKNLSENFVYQDEYAENEFNQEYWSGQHCDSHSQEYPEDWVKRTQQRPRHTTFSNSNY